MKKPLTILILIHMVISNSIAQELVLDQVQEHIDYFTKYVKIPETYKFKSAKNVIQGDEKAYLFRYEAHENNGLLGEHFSFTITEKPFKILGFTHMDKRFSNTKLLSRKATEKIARNFLKNVDGVLEKALENLWIKRHDEYIVLENREKMAIAGMKYKCYNASESNYAWVIVGFNGEIITYERDIRWNTKEQRRITEKWLHDQWLIDQKYNYTLN